MFMDEAKTLPAEMERKRYLAHINSPEDKGYVDMFKRFIEESIVPFQGKIKRKKTTALDFGCGPGPVLAGLLKQNGYETDIYDIYFAPEPVYRRRTYDLITCTEVLEHLKDPLKEITELKKHLKPGGIMAAMTLFHPVDGTPGGDKAFNRWWYRRDRTHISFYRPETFKCLANKLNLKILTVNEKNIVVLALRA
jgi:SAM-dependent methyltransferase